MNEIQTPDTFERAETEAFISRRNVLLGSLAFLTVTGCARQQVDEVIRGENLLTPDQANIPPDSQISEWIERHPEVRVYLEQGLNRLRQAESKDQSPPRSNEEFEQLLSQCRASLRTPANPNVVDQHTSAKNHFEGRIQENNFGLFLDGFNKNLYILNDNMEAILTLSVTTGAAGFGNQQGSGRTPLGPKTVRSLAQGRLNEVVSHNSVPGCTRGNLLDSFQQGQSPTACIVTEYIAIDHGRGIGFHGTNYELDRSGNPKINLATSGGCIRCYNADIAAILASGFITVNMPVFIVGPGQEPSSYEPIEETPVRPDPTTPEANVEMDQPEADPVPRTAPDEGINF